MTIHGPEIDRPAGAAARTEDVEPWRSGDERGADGGRPHHVAASGQAPIPAVDDERDLEARVAIHLELSRVHLVIVSTARIPFLAVPVDLAVGVLVDWVRA